MASSKPAGPGMFTSSVFGGFDMRATLAPYSSDRNLPTAVPNTFSRASPVSQQPCPMAIVPRNLAMTCEIAVHLTCATTTRTYMLQPDSSKQMIVDHRHHRRTVVHGA